MLIGRSPKDRKNFMEPLSTVYPLGPIIHNFALFTLLGLNLEQSKDFIIPISAENKLASVILHLLNRIRRKQSAQVTNEFENHL